MVMVLSSPNFGDGGDIPPVFTCDGDNASPELHWDGVPPGTQSLALIVEDPDAPDPSAPKTTFVHWVLYNIPPHNGGLKEDAAHGGLPTACRQGRNGWGNGGYGGPCPPIGRHRYFHKLYALDTQLAELHDPSKEDLEKAMRGHVIDATELVGTYVRAQR